MIMDYKEKYEQALKVAKETYDKQPMYRDWLEKMYPELAESEDEKVRRAIIEFFESEDDNTTYSLIPKKDILAWLEKQEGCEYIKKDWLEHIKQSWYKEGFIDGKYSGGTSKEWTINDAATLKELIDFLENGTAKLQHDLTRYANWLKNQFTPIEKQGVQKSIWHNEDEEPQRDSLILLIMQSGTPIVAKIIEPNHTFKHGERWAYIDDLLEKQDKQKPIEIISAEESLGIDSDTYNKIVDECIFGEQKPADKVETKFHEGEWVVFNNKHQSIYQVEKIEDGYYILRHTHGGTFRVCVLHDESLRLWTLEDAKDGDVLIIGDIIIIFKELVSSVTCECYCSLCENEFGITKAGAYSCCGAKPATKEQRDLLFQKINEAGYEWDAEKKELKKIEENPADSYCQENCKGFQETGKCFADGECKAKREAEQKSVWSEDDERNLQGVIDEIEANKNQAPDYDLATYDRFLSWLKSLKGRVQPKVELTQWDKNILEAAIAFVEKNNHFNYWGGVDKQTVLSALRSLRSQK